MNCKLTPSDGPCPFCAKGKHFFFLQSDNYTGRVCAAHLHSLLEQESKTEPERKPEAKPTPPPAIKVVP